MKKETNFVSVVLTQEQPFSRALYMIVIVTVIRVEEIAGV